MNDDAVQQTHDRSVAKARFLAKFQRYGNLLRKKWWILALCLALGLGVQFVLSRFGPPSYTSIGRMIVSIKLAIPEGSVYTEELSNFLGTQAALMQSGVVINRAHGRVTAQKPDAVPQRVVLKVSVLPKTTIFVLQGTGADPEYTQAFLQAVMEEYVNLKREMRVRTSDTTFAGLTEEVLRLEKDLRKSDEDMVQFQSTNSVVLLQDQGNSAGNYLGALNNRLAALKSEYDLLRTLTLDQNLDRQQQVSGALPAANDPLDRPNQGGSERMDADYLKAKQQILLLKAEQQDLGQFLRPKHPKMLALTEEVARRERLLDIFRQQSAEQLESRKGSLALQIQNLEKDVKEWDAKTLEISRKTAEHQRLRANGQRIQALYDRLLATMQTLDVNKEISPESVTIMEKASPAFLERAALSKKLLIGALVGMGCAILLLLFLDRLDDRMNSFTELQDLFDESVLGQIPREKARNIVGELGLMQPEDTRHAFVEAYRNLRSSLLYMNESGERPRTLLVTSSVPNEGKSLTSANLAVALANTGSRVLLVDADLRKGVLHGRFGLPAEPGLSEALSQGLNWAEAVRPTKIPNLSLLPRGSFTQKSSELFIGAVAQKFLSETAGAYDYVMVDTAPVMAADDVTSLAPHLDGVMFVVRAEYTSARVARAALELLYQRQVRVLGLIFNAVRPSSGDYYYYHKYKDYYHKYPSAATGEKVKVAKV
jgi:succinoglycan biosynthesis transport protein ExoP